METTAQREDDLYQKVSGDLRKGGFSVTPESINPNDQSALSNIPGILTDITKGDISHIGESTIERLTGGEGPLTQVRTTSSRKPLDMVKRRFKHLIGKAA